MTSKKNVTHRAAAARISLIYALAAGVWIYASDALVAWLFGDPSHLTLLQTYKGWLFVAATAALLYGLISNALTTAQTQPPAGPEHGSSLLPEHAPPVPSLWRDARPPLLIFFLLAGAIGGIGYLIYGHQKDILQRERQAELLAIADAKVAEITHWLAERRRDAEMIAHDQVIAAVVRRWLGAGAPADDDDGKLLSAWLNNLLKGSLDYSAMLLTDDRGQVRLGVGASQLHPKQQALAVQAIQSGQVITSDLHWRQEVAGGTLDLELIAPLGREPAGQGRPVGALVLKLDPERYLFPLIQTWPTPSPSAETLLVRREGDEVVYLSELRHRKNMPPAFRLSVSREHLPAALAIQGREGIVEGLDYRQIPVLAALRRVPETPWFLVAKVDADEVYAPTRTVMLLVATLAGVLITGAGAGIGLWWRQQHTRFLAERYRRELDRRLLVQHFDYLVKYANDIILLMDTQGQIVEANARAVSAYGYTYEELLRLNIRELRDPATRPLVGEQMAQAASSTGLVFETVHRRQDGALFPVEVSSRLIETQGKQYLQSIIRDITERKRMENGLRESEAHLRAIANAVPDVLLVMDEEGRYVDILTSQPQLLYTDPAKLKGKRVSEVMRQELAERVLDVIGKTLRTRQPQVFEYELRIAKVGKRYFEARTAPIEAPGLSKPAVVIMARDITQRKTTEDNLRQAQKMEAVGQLTGGIAHDFNNLLAIILGNLELLAEQLDRPDLQDLVQRPLAAAERGATLIQRLLAFSRRQPLQVKSVDLNRLVAGMIELLRHTLGATVQVKTVLAEGLASTVIDPSQFETALLNLALNARDAMPGGGVLTVETASAHVRLDEAYAVDHQPIEPGRYVMLAVSDTGTGMPPQVLEHAFEPFFTTKAVGKGSGLGLSMVYGLVKQSGGHIHLYSEVGKGTTIKIYLLAAEVEAPAVVRSPETPLHQGRAQTILVVEDDAQVRQLAVTQLHSLGYRTLEADNAGTALEVLAETAQVALLFTDVVLPGGMNGADLALEARRRNPNLKVLFTSGYTEQNLVHYPWFQSAKGKDIALLTKPYRKAELAGKLHALLGGDIQPKT